MFEYNGWVTLRATYLNADRYDDAAYPEGFEDVLALHVNGLNVPDNEVAAVLNQNGSQRVVFYGDRNHPASVRPRLEALLEFLSENAEGSYGEFTCVDWTDGSAERWVLRRGMLIKGPHPEFLPLQPNLEDVYSNE